MNQYDDNSFFEEYMKMDRSRYGLPAAGEWPQLQKLLEPLEGADVLDLGCGLGWHARYAAEHGARSVLGIDGSQNMLQRAQNMTDHSSIQYRCMSIEEYMPEDACFDLVLSNLSLHYILNLEAVYQKLYKALRPGGYFVMNIEHPVFTAGVNQTFVSTPDGANTFWPVDDYFIEGERRTDFLGKIVPKQHHTLTTLLNGLIRCGFTLETVEEVQPDRATIEANGWWDELKRPMMLLVKARKR